MQRPEDKEEQSRDNGGSLTYWAAGGPPILGFLFLLLLFRAAPLVYGGSQARGQIGAITASLCHSSSGSEPCLRPTPQLMAMLDP